MPDVWYIVLARVPRVDVAPSLLNGHTSVDSITLSANPTDAPVMKKTNGLANPPVAALTVISTTAERTKTPHLSCACVLK